jgi:hypothetical protein
MTSQQRLSGYVLVAMPIFIALIIALISPGYFKPFSSRAGRGHSFRGGGDAAPGFCAHAQTIDIEV